MIPKKRLNGMIIDEYSITFRANNSIKKIEGMSPSLTASTRRSPVLARRINKRTAKTAIDAMVQFLYKYWLIKFNVVITWSHKNVNLIY